MLITTKGPGDEITWPCDPAGVTVEADNIKAVVAGRVQFDPVGRDYEAVMDLMAEEPVLDSLQAEDAVIVYLTQHMDDADFPPVLKVVFKAAFESIAEQTDVQAELLRRRHTVEEPS